MCFHLLQHTTSQYYALEKPSKFQYYAKTIFDLLKKLLFE